MAEAGGVGICIDECVGRRLAAILRDLKAPGAPEIHNVRDLGLTSTSDEVLVGELGNRGFLALVTRDSSMLSASVRRDVWQIAGVSVFICDGKWGNLRLFEQARRLLWWWPQIFAQAAAGPQGGAWRVPAEMKPAGLQRLFTGLAD